MSDRPSHVLRLADLPARKVTHFAIEPEAPGRAEVAEALGLLLVRKLRFEGSLNPMGKHDWQLSAHLGATVQQPCVITLEPVTTRIEEDVTRTYAANFELPDGSEVEMPEDDTTDPLPEVLDLVDVMTEALALSLPPYPRKDGAETGEAVFTEPGEAAMTDEDARPFAGLAALRDRLENKDTEGQ